LNPGESGTRNSQKVSSIVNRGAGVEYQIPAASNVPCLSGSEGDRAVERQVHSGGRHINADPGNTIQSESVTGVDRHRAAGIGDLNLSKIQVRA